MKKPTLPRIANDPACLAANSEQELKEQGGTVRPPEKHYTLVRREQIEADEEWYRNWIRGDE